MNNETKLLGVASSPHVSSPIGTRTLMLDVLVALVPSLRSRILLRPPGPHRYRDLRGGLRGLRVGIPQAVT
mgnify:CR=1 FL=1